MVTSGVSLLCIPEATSEARWLLTPEILQFVYILVASVQAKECHLRYRRVEEAGGALRAITGGFISVLLAHAQNLWLRSRRLRGLPAGPEL